MVSGFILIGPTGLTKLIQSNYCNDTAEKLEVLALKCTRRGKEEGSGSRITKVFMAIFYFHGAGLCEQNEYKLTG